jgi:hypothetical protein
MFREIARARAEVKTVIEPIPANVALYADRLAALLDLSRLENLSIHHTGPAHGSWADRRR